MDSVRDLIALPCQHIFCADCVCRWLARQPLCVLCKDDVRSKLPDDSEEFDAAEWREEELKCQLRELRTMRCSKVFQNDISRQASPVNHRTHALVMNSPSPLRRAGDRSGR
eukprot:symbB.v1.2.015833.t1/scaffold1194.1/size132594/6